MKLKFKIDIDPQRVFFHFGRNFLVFDDEMTIKNIKAMRDFGRMNSNFISTKVDPGFKTRTILLAKIYNYNFPNCSSCDPFSKGTK